MITILFWNIGGRQHVLTHLACLAETKSVDVFILAEGDQDLGPGILALNHLDIGTYRQELNANAKVRAVTRLGTRGFIHTFTSIGREMAVWSIPSTGLKRSELFIVGVHLLSKAGGNTNDDQASVAREVIEELNDVEDNVGHRNTVLVGDFNMNPYDAGMTSVTGVHGLMTKDLAGLPDRLHRHKPRRRFYNPMWGLFGDTTPGPAGSYYWPSSVLHNTYWEMLDQVLVRPALINHLTDLTVLDDDGFHKLVSASGTPDRTYLSDHLPVLFRLNL